VHRRMADDRPLSNVAEKIGIGAVDACSEAAAPAAADAA